MELKKEKNVDKTLTETINDVRKSVYSTEGSKKTFIRENFETDENEIVKQDGKLTEEAVKLFKFSEIEPTPGPKHHIEAFLEWDATGTAKELNSKILNMKKNCWIQDQEKHQVKKQEHYREKNTENPIPRKELRPRDKKKRNC